MVTQPEPEVRLLAPFDGAALQRLRLGDSRRRVEFELGEAHHVSFNSAGGETWRDWVFRPAFQAVGAPLAVASEGTGSGFRSRVDRLLFVPTRQPDRPPRVVLPAEAHELVIVFSREGDLLASRLRNLKGPLGE